MNNLYKKPVQMKIAIIGHGRMGQLVEQIAKERGHEISCVIDVDTTNLYSSKEFRESDVAIQFTVPGAAVDGILQCFAAEVPVVVGTTGWNNSLPDIKSMCENGKGTLLYSSNFSIGMNIFMALNSYVSKLMNDFNGYSPSMEEVHHVHKLDHPSGTAVSLAEIIIRSVDRIKGWTEPSEEEPVPGTTLPIYHKREGEVPGIHSVKWDSFCDSITLTHDAKNRSGFAQGAVTAAEWLKGKKGFFTMADMLSSATGTKDVFV